MGDKKKLENNFRSLVIIEVAERLENMGEENYLIYNTNKGCK